MRGGQSRKSTNLTDQNSKQINGLTVGRNHGRTKDLVAPQPVAPERVLSGVRRRERRRDLRWLVSSIHGMLRTERYIGRRVWNQWEWVKAVPRRRDPGLAGPVISCRRRGGSY
jgi:Recombinase